MQTYRGQIVWGKDCIPQIVSLLNRVTWLISVVCESIVIKRETFPNIYGIVVKKLLITYPYEATQES